MNLGVMFGYRHADLNRFNRPVRTRMPGGVAGERPLWLPPMPIRVPQPGCEVRDY
jgi:hypothetical protein